jgi:macrodomain Ter protein organizer (MatP/YcbG family)
MLNLKGTVMNTTTIKKKKIIDLDEQTFKVLSIKAAATGINLKKFIENLLDHEAESYNDSTLYAYLSESRPEGKVMLDPQEKQEFEEWLGLSDKA